MKIRPVGAPIFPFGRIDGRTGTMKLIDAFHNFANALKMVILIKPNSIKRMTKGNAVQAYLKK
jgi:hypothetical protein